MARTYGEDHGLYAQVFLEWLHLLTGDVERARALMARTLALAEQLEDPLAQALAYNYASVLFFLMREPEKVREYAERAKAICLEQGFAFWLARCRTGCGWSRAMLGEVEEGLREIDQGLAFFEAIQQKLMLTYYLSLPVEVHLMSGDFERGLACVEQALGHAETNLDCFYLPELCRLKGELLRARGEPAPVVLEWFERALAQARASGAAFLEMRAAKSMAELLEQRGDRVRARELLTTSLGKIRGGDDARDYREARRLLARL
jgi:predicted ATPase